MVGQIAPWNYPFELSVGDVLPAFAAGNAVVTKPDTQTALTALWARDLLVEAGLPADVWQIVLGEGPVVGPEVVDRGDYVSFTGSTRTGREVAGRAAARLVGCSLELGGKNAMLVLADADLDKAAEGGVRCAARSPRPGSCASPSSACTSTSRWPTPSWSASWPASAPCGWVRPWPTAPTWARSSPNGSCRTCSSTWRTPSRRAPRYWREAGARPDIGPLFYEPTVLDGVEPQMAVCGEETFGPVVSVYRFSDTDEAVGLANATPYGLNSSVWSGSGRRGREVAARLRTGTVNVNEGYASAYGSAQAPMGGMGDSGLGRRHGSEGILKYTESQTVAHQRVLPMAPSLGMSDEAYAAFMSRSLKALKTLRFR